MNSPLFESHIRELYDILDNCEMSPREIQLRKKRIEQSIDLIKKEESLSAYSQYHQRAHEIESIPFLKQFGNLIITEDWKHSEGCDFVLNGHIYIECVCASAGDISKNKLNEFMGEGVFDYNKKKEILNTRFTSSLNDKVRFYYERVGKSIPEDSPYIIFLKTGSLAYEWFEEKYGMALLDILLGRGFLRITINTASGKFIDSGYTHRDYIEKYNGKKINCNLFLNNDFRCVSAILLATSPLGVKYSYKNTFLFINPFASHKIFAKDFWGLIYWKANKEGYYIPRRKGRTLS
jgi:hypothetical protein